jgi:hypothetical protein
MTSTIGWILFLIATISPDPADRVMTYSQYTDCERARNEWLQGPVLRTASVCIPVRVSQPGYTKDDYTAVVYYDSREGKLASVTGVQVPVAITHARAHLTVASDTPIQGFSRV